MIALATTAARGAPVLVSPSTINDGTGYGGDAWTTFTADLNRAATVTTTPALTNLTGYDGVWVDVRQTALTSTESTALTAYIATGRRVVFIGGNAAGFGTWNSSVLGLVGGSDGGPTAQPVLNQLAIVPLTIGVTTAYARGGDVALGGTSLFDQRVATVWGPAQNVVIVLNDNLSSDNDVAKANNATFTDHLAQWVAGGLPDPTSIWQSSTGGAWQTGGNWLANAMPAVADDVVFNRSAGYTTTVAGPVTARTLTVVSDRLTLSFTAPTASLSLGSTLAVGTANSSAGLTLSHSGTGTASVSAGSVTVAANSSLRIDPGVTLTTPSLAAAGPVAIAGHLNLTAAAGTASRVGSLSLVGDSAGQLDLGTSDLIVSGTSLADVIAFVDEAYDGGKWDGPGVTASAAANDAQHRTGIGVIQNVGVDGKPLYATFDGQPVTASDVLVRPTLYGDTNLDGVVDVADYTRIDAGYLARATGWANGDFNDDGVIDGTDYALMDNAFNTVTPTGSNAVAEIAVVPEPRALPLFLAIAMRVGKRRSP